MIKRSLKKRIIIASVALLILLITYMFPTKYSANNIEQKLTYIEPDRTTIYLLDKNNLVTRCNVIIDKKNNDIINQAKKIIDTLTIDSSSSSYNPSGFKSIIPKDTKLKSIDLNDNILKILFN